MKIRSKLSIALESEVDSVDLSPDTETGEGFSADSVDFESMSQESIALEASAQKILKVRQDILAADGISVKMAMEAHNAIPGFFTESNPAWFYTSKPSKVLYSVSMESIGEAISNTISKILEAIGKFIEKVKEWFSNVFSKKNAEKQEKIEKQSDVVRSNPSEFKHSVASVEKVISVITTEKPKTTREDYDEAIEKQIIHIGKIKQEVIDNITSRLKNSGIDALIYRCDAAAFAPFTNIQKDIAQASEYFGLLESDLIDAKDGKEVDLSSVKPIAEVIANIDKMKKFNESLPGSITVHLNMAKISEIAMFCSEMIHKFVISSNSEHMVRVFNSTYEKFVREDLENLGDGKDTFFKILSVYAASQKQFIWYQREIFIISRTISGIFKYIYDNLKEIQKGINAFIGTMSRFEKDYPEAIQEMKKESKPFLDMMERLSSVR